MTFETGMICLTYILNEDVPNVMFFRRVDSNKQILYLYKMCFMRVDLLMFFLILEGCKCDI